MVVHGILSWTFVIFEANFLEILVWGDVCDSLIK
jgi:hypothetical protein